MGQSDSRIYSIFKNLDKDKSGTLSLNELAKEDDPNTPIPYMSSLLAMYHFDSNKKGAINFQEFKRMYEYIQKILHSSAKKNLQNQIQGSLNQFSKKIKVEYEKQFIPAQTEYLDSGISVHHKSMNDLYSLNDSPEIDHNLDNSTFKPLDKQADKLIDKPINSSNQIDNSSNQIAENLSLRRRGSIITMKSHEHSKYENLTSIQQRDIQISIHQLFNWKSLNNDIEKNNFLNWLFKLCDTEKTGIIDLKELKLFMKIVAKDGIDISALIFHEDKNIPENPSFDDLINIIMKQFDIGEEGFLDKKEFFTLGRLILSCYQSIERLTEYSNMIVDDCTLKYTLGKGAYGIVKFGVNSSDFYAVKVVKLGNVSDMSKLDCEIQCLEMLKHPNIVQLHKVFNDEERIYLFMELCGGGTLYQLLEDKPFSEPIARFYFKQLIEGLSYCQSQGVCHRDLKLENLLLSNNGDLKISDFGAARIFTKGWDIFTTQMAGSIYHLSPEQVLGNVYSGSKVDVWSCGVILFSFLTGELPFCSDNIEELFNQIQSSNYTFPSEINISNDAKDLINKMLTVDPESRIKIEDILKHPWLHGEKKKICLTEYNMKFSDKDLKIFCDQFSEELINRDTFMLIKKHSDTIYIGRCVQASRYLQFTSNICKQPDGSIIVSSKLIQGGACHFLKLMKHIHKGMKK